MSEAPTEPQARKPRDWFVIIAAVVIVLVIAAVVAWALFAAVRHTPSENAASANAYVRSSVNLVVYPIVTVKPGRYVTAHHVEQGK